MRAESVRRLRTLEKDLTGFSKARSTVLRSALGIHVDHAADTLLRGYTILGFP